jgi:hypothetical protein
MRQWAADMRRALERVAEEERRAEKGRRLIDWALSSTLPTRRKPRNKRFCGEKEKLVREYVDARYPNGVDNPRVTTKAVMRTVCDEHVNRGGEKDYFSFNTVRRALKR